MKDVGMVSKLTELRLNMLSQKKKIQLAENNKTTAETLVLLLGEDDIAVTQAVAENPNTPASSLVLLAQSADVITRRRVARNIKAPEEALELLVGDKDHSVLYNLAHNTNATTRVLDLVEAGGDAAIFLQLASNPRAGSGLLERLSECSKVWYEVAVHANTPSTVLVKMYYQAVASDKLTENFAGFLLKRKVQLPEMELLALVAVYGANMAKCVRENEKVVLGSLLDRQLKEYEKMTKAEDKENKELLREIKITAGPSESYRPDDLFYNDGIYYG